MNEKFSSVSIVLHLLAVFVFILLNRTPPETTAEIFWFAGSVLCVLGTALVALVFKKERTRVVTAALIISAFGVLRFTL
jgi:hypothetical protein